ncbi:MAG: hypothetical protein K2M65_06880 [Muribaculaceae bacterium]|nr:hypothetical protein [Muribaculaceae bacterium]
MNFYSQIMSLALVALPAFTFVACSDDDNETSYPAKLEIVTSSGNEFDGRGGSLELLVNSNVNYTVTTDVDWITVAEGRAARPLNGKLTFVVAAYDAALDMTPRTGIVTLSAEGVQSATYTVKQVPGDLFRFEITSPTTFSVPAKGGDVEVAFNTNVEYTVAVSDPSWINQTSAAAGKYTFAIAENTVTDPRDGFITFTTAELGDFKGEINQAPFVVAKGIASAQDMMNFAAAVNAGTSLEAFTDENGEVVMLADIDMTGMNWTPIGNVTGSTIASSAPTLGTGNPFKGIFNGNGHTIRNLAMSTDDAQCLGLFGICENATVKNLNIDASCSLKVANEEMAYGCAYGFIAGVIMNSTVENVKVSGTVPSSLLYKGATKYFASLGGVVGFSSKSTMRNCSFDGKIERVRSNVYDNTIGASVAGILGFACGAKNAETVVENCTNAGYIYAETHRVAGVLARTNGHYILRGCTNSGIVHASAAEASAAGWTSGLRVGGVFAFSSNTNTNTVAIVENCTNSGTVICEGDAKTAVGALCGLPRCVTLTNGVNTGTLITTGNCIAGLLIGQLQCDDKPTITSAQCGGKIATAFTGSGANITPVNPIVITAENYFEYATGTITGTNSGIWTTNNVTFLGQ